MFIAYR